MTQPDPQDPSQIKKEAADRMPEMTPRECPECGGLRVRRSTSGSKRAREMGSVVVRHLTCRDCGYEGVTGEFWAHGEQMAGLLEVLIGQKRSS